MRKLVFGIVLAAVGILAGGGVVFAEPWPLCC